MEFLKVKERVYEDNKALQQRRVELLTELRNNTDALIKNERALREAFVNTFPNIYSSTITFSKNKQFQEYFIRESEMFDYDRIYKLKNISYAIKNEKLPSICQSYTNISYLINKYF